MLKTAIATAVLLLAVQSRSQMINWSLQVEQGIAYAKKNDKPIMFYVRGTDGGGDDFEDYEREHRKTFANVDVKKLSQRYVCLQMSRSRYRQQLLDWGLSGQTNLQIVFSTPAGERIGEPLAPSAISNPGTLLRKMKQVLKEYGSTLYKEKVEPVFGDEKAGVREIRDALKMITEWEMEPAAPQVMEVLERERLDQTTRTSALNALAAIGNRTTIDHLLGLAIEGDRAAVKALHDAPVGAAEHLLPNLGGEDFMKHVASYQALARICKIRGPKPERFWQGPNEIVKQKEVDRVRAEVEDKLKAWKAEQP